jgi:hypothetical protein
VLGYRDVSSVLLAKSLQLQLVQFPVLTARLAPTLTMLSMLLFVPLGKRINPRICVKTIQNKFLTPFVGPFLVVLEVARTRLQGDRIVLPALLASSRIHEAQSIASPADRESGALLLRSQPAISAAKDGVRPSLVALSVIAARLDDTVRKMMKKRKTN